MNKKGAIILGIGGDNSCSAVGTFYEGAMTASYTTDATDAAVQARHGSVAMASGRGFALFMAFFCDHGTPNLVAGRQTSSPLDTVAERAEQNER